MVQLEKLPPHRLERMIPWWTVNNRIHQMGAELVNDSPGVRPILLDVKKGGVVFGKGLAWSAKRNGLKFDRGSIGISSYGKEMLSNMNPEVSEPLDIDVDGRVIEVGEDIVDTGYTMDFLIKHLNEMGAAAVFINALLWKPSRELVKVPIKRYGFIIPDKFVVGTGIDWKEHYRRHWGISEVIMTAKA